MFWNSSSENSPIGIWQSEVFFLSKHYKSTNETVTYICILVSDLSQERVIFKYFWRKKKSSWVLHSLEIDACIDPYLTEKLSSMKEDLHSQPP